MALQGKISKSGGNTVTIDMNGLNLEFYFSNITRETIDFGCDITDHLVENNSNVQDHIAVKPITYTMSGLIGEKVFYNKPSVAHNLFLEFNRLIPIKTILPTATSYVQSAINGYEAIRNKAQTIYNAMYDFFVNKKWNFKKHRLGHQANNLDFYGRWSKRKSQLNALETLNHCRLERLPVNVTTGWGNDFYEDDNFYIVSVSMTQGETYHQSDITVTLKQLRFAGTETRQFDAEDYKRYSQQMETQQELGKIQGAETPLESHAHKFGVEKGILKG